jgi:hypothetical protein
MLNFKMWAEIICSLFLSTFLSTAAVAQESFVHVNGTVISEADSSGISYAYVYLAGAVTGTVANSDGNYELKITKSSSNNEICFSALGYKTACYSLAIQADTTLNIVLQQAVYELKEVVVEPDAFDSALYIFDTAVESIKKNYPTKAHLMEGFYRELSMKDTAYARLIEAAVLVQENGYHKDYFKGTSSLEETKSRARVIEIRKSDDFREYSLWSKAMTLLLGERNELYMILRHNLARMLQTKTKNYLYSADNIRRSKLEYSAEAEWDGQPVYVISATIPQGFRNEELKFFINKADDAIVRVEQVSHPGKLWAGNKSMLIEGKYFDRFDVTYRKITDKYYPVFIHQIWSAYNASATAESNGSTVRQYSDIVFLLTNIYEEDYSKIRWRKAEDQDKDLYDNTTPYNEKFWENYNTVKLNPLKRPTADLEKEKSLKEQYKNH